MTKDPIQSAGSLLSSTEERTALRRALRVIDSTSSANYLHYKLDLLLRRFLRRVNGRDFSEYLALLEDSQEEQVALERSFLIGVTDFFRDPAFFEILQTKWLPELIEQTSFPLRIWVPACSSGEEAYSLAIILDELLDAQEDFHIFATDIDSAALDLGANAYYRKSDLASVGPDRVDRFFDTIYTDGLAHSGSGTGTGTGSLATPDLVEPRTIRVKKRLRQHVTFSHHDVLTDTPFANIHLVSCRNLLIYLEEEGQHDVIANARRSLEPGGLLALGSSEFLRWPTGFRVLDRNNRLFQRIEDNGALARPGANASSEARPPNDLPDQIVQRYVPRGFLVTAEGRLIRCFGGAERYLRIRRRRSDSNLFTMLPADLTTELVKALKEATWDSERVRLREIMFAAPDGTERVFDVSIEPINAADEQSPDTFFIAFEPTGQATPQQRRSVAERSEGRVFTPEHSSMRASQLKERLAALRKQRRVLSEELSGARISLAREQQRREHAEKELEALNDAIKRLQD